MKRTRIISSNLVSIGYNEIDQLLEIEFKGKKIYLYEGVPTKIWHGLMAAPSAGSYFDANIRHVYPFKSIIEPEQE